MTSFTPRQRLSRAAMAAHAPPPAHPARAITGSISQVWPTGKNRATPVAVSAPTYSCPSPPTFTSPTRVGMAVARAVRSSGIMVTPTSLRPRLLPNTPCHTFSRDSTGSCPDASRNTAKTARASTTPRTARGVPSSSRAGPMRRSSVACIPGPGRRGSRGFIRLRRGGRCRSSGGQCPARTPLPRRTRRPRARGT